MPQILKDSGLTIVLMLLFAGSLLGQWLSGWAVENEELARHGAAARGAEQSDGCVEPRRQHKPEPALDVSSPSQCQTSEGRRPSRRELPAQRQQWVESRNALLRLSPGRRLAKLLVSGALVFAAPAVTQRRSTPASPTGWWRKGRRAPKPSASPPGSPAFRSSACAPTG